LKKRITLIGIPVVLAIIFIILLLITGGDKYLTDKYLYKTNNEVQECVMFFQKSHGFTIVPEGGSELQKFQDISTCSKYYKENTISNKIEFLKKRIELLEVENLSVDELYYYCESNSDCIFDNYLLQCVSIYNFLGDLTGSPDCKCTNFKCQKIGVTNE